MARYIGNYEVVRELGAGRFGAVYLAVGDVPGRGLQPGRRRVVAVKKLKDAADEESVNLLLQEFALLDQVKHRSIVRVFEYLEDENAVVMEYIHGVTLRRMFEELNKAHEQVFTEAAIEIGCEMADALYQAWTTPGDNGEPLQLVHRDLKPANVIVTPNGEVKILDWGLARVDNADFRKEARDRVKGTPMYMAPEQAGGLEVDHRTDLFAVGLILYELLMNEPVYGVPADLGRSADPFAEIMARIEAGQTDAQCRAIEKKLPNVGSVVTRCLQARPLDRYQHGHDLLLDLRRSLYRDRGAYLQEFCEFFFGTICDVGEAPNLETVGATGRQTTARRASIEERLRQSMAREAKAKDKATQVTTSPGVAAAPGSDSASSGGANPGRATPGRASPGRATPGRATPGRAAPGRATPDQAAPVRAPQAQLRTAPPPPTDGSPVMADTPSGGSRKPPKPPVGGGASRAAPFTPPAGASKPKMKPVGQRRPDETGMLEMVPLSSDDDEAEAGADPSATAFFAIPAPKAERAGSSGTGPPPPPAPPPVAAPGLVGPSPGPTGVAGAPPPQPMIQGPVASYGQSGGQTPFQVQMGAPVGAPPADAGQRIQSNRVYAIVFGVFLLVCVAVIVAVWLRPAMDDKDDVVAQAPVVPAVDNTKKRKVEADTGIAEPAPKPAVRPASTSRGTTTSKPAAAAPSGPGTLTVTLSDPSQATAIEVVCPSGFRQRVTFKGGVASVAGVPQEACTLHFKGGAPAKFQGVHGNMSVKCAIIDVTAKCQ